MTKITYILGSEEKGAQELFLLGNLFNSKNKATEILLDYMSDDPETAQKINEKDFKLQEKNLSKLVKEYNSK